ncbi:MAG: hypothetical protein LBD93_09360 [Treponema sp.]|jgi:hypothetical protein|nr:hypothetical protein [Treponema sp.]
MKSQSYLKILINIRKNSNYPAIYSDITSSGQGMIAEFTLENYRLFTKKHTFSLISIKNKELSDTNAFEGPNKRVARLLG